jgi:hypothetical protein
MFKVKKICKENDIFKSNSLKHPNHVQKCDATYTNDIQTVY